MNKLLMAFLCLFAFEAQADGLRAEQVVLKGLFIRAGGPGGTKSLSTGLLNELCQEGVKTVFYLYPSQSFSTKGTYSCEGNVLEYKGSGFMRTESRPVLVAIHNAANTNSGPVIAHCWNGWHASGEVAAHALMQFCGWSGEAAAQYWADNIGDKGNIGKYGSIKKRIKKFEPYSDLSFTAEQKNQYCP